MVDGQLALKTNHPYLYQVMSPMKLEICVNTATSYISWRAVKKTGYKLIFCRVVCLVKVVETQYIFIYLFTELKQIMHDANSKVIPYISVQFVLLLLLPI